MTQQHLYKVHAKSYAPHQGHGLGSTGLALIFIACLVIGIMTCPGSEKPAHAPEAPAIMATQVIVDYFFEPNCDGWSSDRSYS